jgi:hypothetical protein
LCTYLSCQVEKSGDIRHIFVLSLFDHIFIFVELGPVILLFFLVGGTLSFLVVKSNDLIFEIPLKDTLTHSFGQGGLLNGSFKLKS